MKMSLQNQWKSWVQIGIAVASGVGMSFAFPGPYQQLGVSWYAFVPLCILLRFSTVNAGFWRSFFAGLGFWMATLAWFFELRHNGGPWGLVFLGYLGLSVWCSLFWGLWGAGVAALWRGGDSPQGGWRQTGFEAWRPLAMAFLWSGAEYLRSTLLTGFAWNALGVSMVSLPYYAAHASGLGEGGKQLIQRTVLPVIQVASVGGVYAVSALIVLVNASLAGVAVRMYRVIRRSPLALRRHVDLTLCLVVLLMVMLWGTGRVKRLQAEEVAAPRIRIGAVNPGLPCILEADMEGAEAAYRGLWQDIERVGLFRPDLIVLPETVLYDAMPSPAMEHAMGALVARVGAPILAGGTEWVMPTNGPEKVYNASFLFGQSGRVESVYRKQHLVPFGEYIPFDKQLVWLQRFAPTGISCSPGEAPVVMEVGAARVSPLICFEDTVSALSRRAVAAGATVLVSQSNDAWFRGSAEPMQHHAQAVFRAVENGVPMVRASNQGASTVITTYGASAEDAEGGYFVQPVAIPHPVRRTLYHRFGDWVFGIPCAVALVISVLFGARKRSVNEVD